MAKNNNKGFSLIEIIIAVAILSILMTPIIKQFANTLETSRKAKALQEVNETAVYEVEEFQSYSKEDLDDKYGTPVTKADMPLTMYAKDGTVIASISYNAYVYTLAEQEIGAKRDKYTNTVVLDDLSNKVRAHGGKAAPVHYKVAYGLTDADLATVGSGFTLTNEGSIVEYDADGYVSGIVCTDKNADGSDVSYVENPNDVNLGNMHDLDKNCVALILGGTSSYDSQAFTALFSKAMEHLRELDYESWQQALVNVDNESILSQDSMNNSKRLIKIYTDKTTDAATGKECYIVKADVYYDYQYSLIVDGAASSTYHDMVTYTVFSQKFFTKEPPEIYFEYQPYCVTGEDTGNVTYQKNDYILFDNHVDECKLYLYKPFKDQQNAAASLSDYYTVDTDGDGVNDAKEEYYTYYTTSSKTQKVQIHLASKQQNQTVYLNEKDEQTSSQNRIYIFTNLETEGYRDANTSCQFVSDSFSGVFDYVKGENETKQNVTNEVDAVYTKYALGTHYNTMKPAGDGSTISGESKILYKLSEDTRESERLYTITVKLVPEKDSLNTVRLSGAKGAN